MIKPIAGALAVLALALGSFAATQDAAQQPTPTKEQERAAEVIAAQAPSYPLDVCIVSGEKFTEESPAVDVVADGHLLRTCCKRCAKKVKEKSKGYIEKVRKAVIRQQKDLWPLKSCPVSDEAYGGEMGDPIDMVVGTRYVKLCCGGCKKAVKKDPAAFLAKLDEKLIPELAKTYPTQMCIVSGERLGSMGDPVNVMYGYRLVRFCCKGCIRAYKKDPAAWVAKIYSKEAAEKTSGGDK